MGRITWYWSFLSLQPYCKQLEGRGITYWAMNLEVCSTVISLNTLQFIIIKTKDCINIGFKRLLCVKRDRINILKFNNNWELKLGNVYGVYAVLKRNYWTKENQSLIHYISCRRAITQPGNFSYGNIHIIYFSNNPLIPVKTFGFLNVLVYVRPMLVLCSLTYSVSIPSSCLCTYT